MVFAGSADLRTDAPEPTVFSAGSTEGETPPTEIAAEMLGNHHASDTFLNDDSDFVTPSEAFGQSDQAFEGLSSVQ